MCAFECLISLPMTPIDCNFMCVIHAQIPIPSGWGTFDQSVIF